MNELKKYITKSLKDRIIIFISGILCGCAGILSLMQKTSWIIIIAMFLACIILLFEGTTAHIREKKLLELLAGSEDLSQAAAEFSSAKSYADGDIKLGDTMIFRKRIMSFLRYYDITMLICQESSDDHDSRLSLYAKLKNGREELICHLHGAEKEKAAQEIADAVRSHNLSIRKNGFRL